MVMESEVMFYKSRLFYLTFALSCRVSWVILVLREVISVKKL